MSVNPTIGMIGVAKQASRDVAAESPKYVHGLTGGSVFKLDRSVEAANVACGARAGTDSYVSEISTGADFETYGYADVLPLYFLGALGNIASAAATGTGAGMFTHTVKLGSELPYFTFWGRIGNEDVSVTSGCKIDTLAIDFEGNKPLAFGVTAVGCKAGRLLNTKEIPGSITASCFDGYFVCTGGVFQLDTSADTPTDAFVTAGSLELKNDCTERRKAGEVMPANVSEKKLTTSGSVTVEPDNLNEYWKMVTGAASGTTPSGELVYGSLKWVFKHSKNPKLSMEVSATHVPFTCDYPEVDPEGEAATLEFAFDDIGIAAKDGSPLTVTITNDVASYL